MFIRNLLLHNGTSASAILEHSHQLLRPGGHLFCVEADITRLQFLNAAPHPVGTAVGPGPLPAAGSDPQPDQQPPDPNPDPSEPGSSQ